MKKLIPFFLILTFCACKKDYRDAVIVTFHYKGDAGNFDVMYNMPELPGERVTKHFNSGSFNEEVNVSIMADYRDLFFTLTSTDTGKPINGVMSMDVEGRTMVRDSVHFNAEHPSATCQFTKY